MRCFGVVAGGVKVGGGCEIPGFRFQILNSDIGLFVTHTDGQKV